MLFFVGITISAQELPPVQNFLPSEYKAENQNWAISQSKDKLIYVANSKGLLEFNGAKWTLFPSPNETIIRSVKVVGERIYTGCYMEFGYWKKNTLGKLRYTSLSKKIKQNLVQDEEFWNILSIDRLMVFQSLNHFYIYDLQDDSVKVIESETTLPKVFNFNKNLYFQTLHEGLYRIENDSKSLRYNSELFLENEVINIFQYQDGLLVLTRDKGFFKVEKGITKPWEIAADTLLSKVSVYSALKLKNGTYALGTIAHGVLHLDSDGKLLNQIDQLKGLRNNTVLSLFEDVDGNLWLGLDNGISFINLTSPINVYHDSRGVVGSVYVSVLHRGNLYLGTNQGLFYKKIDGTTDFERIPGTQGQVWSLNVIDNELFCGHHMGTFLIKNDRASSIANVQGTWNIKPMEGRPGVLLQGNYDGLYLLEKANGSWQLKNKISGFEHSSRYFEFFDKKIFVNHEYKGLFTIHTDADLTKALNVDIDTIVKGSNSGIKKYRNDLLYCYEKGVLKYDKDKSNFVKDSLLSLVISDEDYISGKMTVDEKNGFLWIFSKSGVNYISESNLASKPIIKSVPMTIDTRNGIVGYENVTALNENNKYLFGTSSGYFTVNIDAFPKQDFSVQIATISNAGKNNPVKQNSLLDKNREGDLKSYENNLEIAYYAPEYKKYLKPEYQYQLLGMYPGWSPWKKEASISFENLPYGSYTFKVRAKIGDRISGNTATYSFQIKRPWYISYTMLGLYLLVFILASIFIHNLYRRYYHKSQQKLIERNRREMELAKAQNEKEIIKIKNEQLKEEFRSKSNELAASTLSIIRKNELLSKVKEQLVSSVEDKESVKPIVSIIDKSLNQNDDWELFKEAFNNADRKFLKKLKKSHPNLSPNDIRLCAYLRLNLSSKEIAPLLNISARSVEIKRYRLRKKMNLDHDANLVNYILKL
ncbi:MAG: triple tyrosine motif-containing protein [Bacteroidota bacterium]